jgi:O-antigen/teichoic acid export membrane protein
MIYQHVKRLQYRIQSNSVLRLMKNSGLLVIANLVYRLGSIVLIALLARFWGQAGVAAYVLSMSWGGYAVFLADFGLSVLGIRMMSTVPAEEKGHVLGKIFSTKLILIPVFAFAAVAAYIWLPYSFEVRVSILIVGCGIALNTFSQSILGVFRSAEKMEYEALVTITSAIGWIVLGTAVTLLWKSIIAIALAFCLLHLLQLIFVITVCRRFICLPKLKLPLKPLSTLKQSLPFGVTSVIARGYTETDIQVLSFFVTSVALGSYSAAARLVVVASILPVFVSQAVFPVASRLWSQQRRTEFEFLFRSSIQYQLAVSILIAILLNLLASPLVTIMFGDNFGASVLILEWLVLVIPLKYVSQSLGNVLESSGHQHVRSMTALLGLVFAWTLNLFLVPMFGIGGAVVAVLVTEAAMLTAMAYKSRTLLNWNIRFSSSLFVILTCGTLTYICSSLFASWTAGEALWMYITSTTVVTSLIALILFYLSKQLPGLRSLQNVHKLNPNA